MTMYQGTLVSRIHEWAERRGDKPALHAKDESGRWQCWTWRDYWRDVQGIGSGLIALGHKPHECVAIAGANHAEWVLCQFGIQAAQGIPAPIYVTNTVEQYGYILNHSRASIVIVGSQNELDRILKAEEAGLTSTINRIISFRPIQTDDKRVLSVSDLIEEGRGHEETLAKRVEAQEPTDTCMLIYTSGTTGVPKAVELNSHGQFMIGAAVGQLAPTLLEEDRYHVVSYLPLSHQAEQLLTNVCTLVTGGQAYFCFDMQQLKDHLVDVRPTVFLGVPRVWEKFQAALETRLAEQEGWKSTLATWARKTEYDSFLKDPSNDPAGFSLKRKLARKLVIDKIKSALGLDRLEVALTGSAPIATSTQEFFSSLGITISEAYGLTETSGVATITDPKNPAFGTVGKPLDGVRIRISDEGEIQLKGENNTKGYLHMPEESKAIYTADGWLKTGDLGTIDGSGNLKITGRIKELIITAGGKNVAPIELENHVKSIAGIGQAVAVGERRPYLTMLLTLDSEALPALSESSGISGNQPKDFIENAAFQNWLKNEINERCNKKVARYQTIKKFRILEDDFTIEGGELTANMKVRRTEVAKKYADLIDELYAN